MEIPKTIEGYGELKGKVFGFAMGFYFCMLLLSDGKVLRIGQNNREPVIGNAEGSGFCVVDCPVRVKSIACGSNHTAAVSFEGQVWGWGDSIGEFLEEEFKERKLGRFHLPGEYKQVKFYNVACCGFSVIASGDEGVFYWGGSLMKHVKGSEQLIQSIEEKGKVFKFSNQKPQEIRQIYANYSGFYVIDKEGEVTSGNAPLEILKANMSKAELVISCTNLVVKWSTENHHFFDRSFRESVFTFFLFMRRRNNEKKVAEKVPRVLWVEIVKFLSEILFNF